MVYMLLFILFVWFVVGRTYYRVFCLARCVLVKGVLLKSRYSSLVWFGLTGRIRVVFDFGFERQEVVYPESGDRVFKGGQFHTLRVRREDNGQSLHVQVNTHCYTQLATIPLNSLWFYHLIRPVILYTVSSVLLLTGLSQ